MCRLESGAKSWLATQEGTAAGMPTPILATKLYLPPLRPHLVLRTRLLERLNEGLHHPLTLISAPAGFGKTTLLSAWLAGCARPAAWLSLDDQDRDLTRFLTYLVAALQTLALPLEQGCWGRCTPLSHHHPKRC
jgi:LuxR family transcriptional regulator, maltose regulon positive regulatory protein